MYQPTLGYIDLLAAVLRGQTVSADRFHGLDLEDLHRAIVAHDVLALVADAAAAQPHLPEPLRRRLQREAEQEIALDLLREAELRRALAALSAAGIQPIVMKGSHLAYTHFARPHLRSRLDSDLLIPPAARADAHQVLTQRLGYSAAMHVTGELTATQQTYRRANAGALTHQFDVHWRYTNAAAFAHALTYDEIRAAAVAVPALAPTALAPHHVHALLIACIHRIAHHDDDEELKWFVDIDLLASAFSDADWRRFVALAGERRVAAVCLHSLRRTAELLGTAIPEQATAALGAEGPTLTAAYLGGSSQAGMLAADLRALPSWRDRLRLLREHLLPPAEYMRRRYAPGSRAPLAWLYLRRIVRGAVPWLRRRM
jgi:hypothetical protein